MPEPSNFVLMLTQPDPLGMPVGPVLRTSGTEMRSLRQPRAENLAPPIRLTSRAILVGPLGPAASDIGAAFG